MVKLKECTKVIITYVKNKKKRRNKSFFSDIKTSQLVDELKSRFNDNCFKDVIDYITSDEPNQNAKNIWNEFKKAKPIKLTPSEGLSLMTELNLTHIQYSTLIKILKKQNVCILPNIQAIKKEKKNCYPPNVKSSETLFEIPLQDNLDHTFKRLAQTIPLNESKSDTLVALVKIGFDGNSGRNQYHVRTTATPTGDFSSIMHTAFVPINLTDTENNIVWKNDNASSVRFCRPCRISWEKEDKESMKAEFNRLTIEQNNLNPTVVQSNGKEYKIIYRLIFTMFDGKAVSCLTNTSSSMVCPNCKATPNDFNKLESISKFQVHRDTLIFGISPLHMFIRALEYILHVAYRLYIEKWRVEKENKPKLKERKTEIQLKYKDIGLKVDQVRQGSGTSNTGNVARLIFAKPALASKITGVDEGIITNLQYMLTAINSGRVINRIFASKIHGQ